VKTHSSFLILNDFNPNTTLELECGSTTSRRSTDGTNKLNRENNNKMKNSNLQTIARARIKTEGGVGGVGGARERSH